MLYNVFVVLLRLFSCTEMLLKKSHLRFESWDTSKRIGYPGKDSEPLIQRRKNRPVLDFVTDVLLTKQSTSLLPMETRCGSKMQSADHTDSRTADKGRRFLIRATNDVFFCLTSGHGQKVK